MERRTVVEVKCPRCGKSGKARIRQFIDARADPRARKALLAGRLNLYRCRNCSFTDNMPADVLYYDPDKEFCVLYAPLRRTREDDFLDRLDDEARPVILDPGSGADAPDCLRHVHLVLSLTELADYVVFRERLWKRRAAPDRGLVTCFSCDRSIGHGEHYFCVSRVLREKDCQDEGRIVDSTSSLQICADCRRKAESQAITFGYAPMPLLRLEREGFRRFAREHRNWAPRHGQETPAGGSCSLCHAGIGLGERYVTIELSEETSKPRCVETLEAHGVLAVVCGKCADRYMVWLDLAERAA